MLQFVIDASRSTGPDTSNESRRSSSSRKIVSS